MNKQEIENAIEGYIRLLENRCRARSEKIEHLQIQVNEMNTVIDTLEKETQKLTAKLQNAKGKTT